MDAELSGFVPTNWEWEPPRGGVYFIDRAGFDFCAQYRTARSSVERVAIDARDEKGALDWPTAESAMRACWKHHELMATMGAHAAARVVADISAEFFAARKPTLRGLAPVVEMLPALRVPRGAWL